MEPPGGEVQKAAVDNGLKLEGEVRAGIIRDQVSGYNSPGRMKMLGQATAHQTLTFKKQVEKS